jgi:hypothetical protein
MSDNNGLTGRQVVALTTLFTQTLLQPQRMKDLLTTPSDALIDVGMSDEEIVEIMEYLRQFKAVVKKTLEDTGDIW